MHAYYNPATDCVYIRVGVRVRLTQKLKPS